ncbi:MAG: aminopeptidase P family protein [Anaerolineae bacterium]|nr:aminopeptidase P family protein [Anaerolineae bacterium]
MGTQATLAERDLRYAKIRAAMEAQGFDALLIAGKGHWWTGRGYFRYLTDFHLWGHDALILFPLQNDPLLTITSYALAQRVRRTGWITDTRGDVYLIPNMVKAIQERGLGRARIGICGFQWVLPVGAFETLQQSLPGVEFVNADALLNDIRMVKSELEIQQIREHWTLSKACMERFVEIVGPGKTQRELAAECSRLALAGGVRDILVFISEDGSANTPQDEPLACTDIVTYHMEMSGESGHWSEITVNCCYREPSDVENRLLESELRAYHEIRQMAKPGARLSDMARTFERVLIEDGWELGPPTDHYDFHGQGMDTIETPWYAAEPTWGASQDRELVAGMVFSYHPRRVVSPQPQRTPGLNEDVLITANGIDRLAGDWDLRWRMMR